MQGRPQTLDVIACDGCGRHFATTDGPGMIAAIKGPCPDCGGRFKLSPPSSEDRLL
jgi:rRNA maturation endonuclease Nob1